MNKKIYGTLEVIAGPMYCGKTEELIRLVKRATIGKKKIQTFKHKIDVRYGKEKKLHSHNGISYDSETTKTAEEILAKVNKATEIVAIDEAQWYGDDLIPVIKKLLSQGKHVIVAGLAMTFDQQPFTPIPHLMSMADKIKKLSAICHICGEDAVYHKRVAKETKDIDAKVADPSFVSKLDETVFQARCRSCFEK